MVDLRVKFGNNCFFESCNSTFCTNRPVFVVSCNGVSRNSILLRTKKHGFGYLRMNHRKMTSGDAIPCYCFYDSGGESDSLKKAKDWASVLFGNFDENPKLYSVDDSSVPIAEEDQQLQLLVDRLERGYKTMNWRRMSRIIRSFPYRMTKHRAIKLVNLLGSRAKWQIAVNVIQWLEARDDQDPRADRYIYTTLISALGERHPHSVMEIFHIMIKKGETYPDMPCYHAISVALGRAGFLEELLQVMEILRKGVDKRLPEFKFSLRTESQLFPDTVVYNAVLNACAKKKEWKAVEWVFKSMNADGIHLDSASYGLAIEVMEKCGKTEEAIMLFEKMKEKEYFPNAKTYKCMISVMSQIGDMDKAVSFFNEMKQRGLVINASVYYALAVAYCVNGQANEAFDLISKIEKCGDAQPLVCTYTGLIRACFHVGHYDKAASVFRRMVEQKCEPNMTTYNLMLRVYASMRTVHAHHKTVDMLWATVPTMDHKYPRNQHNGTLMPLKTVDASDMSGYAQAHQVYNSIKRGKMFGFPEKRLTSGNIRISPDNDTFTAMLHASVKWRQWMDFADVFSDMIRAGWDIHDDDYAYFLQESVKDSQIDVSRMLIKRIERRSDSRREGDKKKANGSFLYEAELITAANAKKLECVLQLLDKVIKSNQFVDSSTLLHVVSSFKGTMNAEVSDKLLQRINRVQCSPDARIYSELIRSLLSLKHDVNVVQNALAIMCGMQSIGVEVDVGLYSSMIRACFRVMLWHEVVDLYTEGCHKGYEFDSTVKTMADKSMVNVKRESLMHNQACSMNMDSEVDDCFDDSPSPFEIITKWREQGLHNNRRSNFRNR